LNQKAENIEAVVLGESGQRGQSVLLFHNSIEIEISTGVKDISMIFEINRGPGCELWAAVKSVLTSHARG